MSIGGVRAGTTPDILSSSNKQPACRAGLLRQMKRRAFIALLGGSAVAWPLASRAQQHEERMRRIGVIMSTGAGDPESELRLAAFVQALQQAGWTVGRTLQIDTRWTSGTAGDLRRATGELLGQ